MPIRIRPIQELKPCTLNLDSLRGITELISSSLSQSVFSATDGSWEVYGETRDSFLKIISERSKLDSFKVDAGETVMTEIGGVIISEPSKSITIVFSEKEAKVTFDGRPEHENWFEHFMIDLGKHILRPSLRQIIVHVYGERAYRLGLPYVVAVPVGQLAVSTPYSRIIIEPMPRNEFVENVKANLVSNIIWVVLGIIFTIAAQWLLKWFGVDLSMFK